MSELGEPRPVGEGGVEPKPVSELGEPRPTGEGGVEPKPVSERGEPKLEHDSGDPRPEGEFGETETIEEVGGSWREDSCLERWVALNVLKSAVAGCLR